MVKIWKHSSTLAEAITRLKKRGCWQKCDDCKKEWSKTQTKNVSMKIELIKAGQITRFICDDCTDEREKEIYTSDIKNVKNGA